MTLLLLSFIAGVLTVLAPCVLPLLPIIIGGSLGSTNKFRPYWIIGGLILSITIFTILLKASTVLLNVDPVVWKFISGGILVLFGLTYLFPQTWDKISAKLKLSSSSDELLNKANQKEGWLGAVLIGGALGPVFASCSPTYSLIIATVLPVNFFQGVIYIVVYALGLAVVMLAIALLGRQLVKRLNVLANPQSWFKKVLAVIFILVGLSIITGVDKQIETNLLDAGLFDITRVDQNLLEQNMPTQNETNLQSSSNLLTPELNKDGSMQAPEITGIQSWLNSNGESLGQLKGKVVLVDFWTYSCINCQRTLPFVTKWYDTYKDQGFVVLGIHAPEFAFEKKQENVAQAIKDNGIHYPVALDNDFKTWNAYKNQFWPAEYLIDKNGKIRRTHFGEGQYAETEKAIRFLLQEQGQTLAQSITQPLVADNIKDQTPAGKYCQNGVCTNITPETYLGSERGSNFENAAQVTELDTQTSFALKDDPQSNYWTLGGDWSIQKEQIQTDENGAKLRLKFNGQHVYLVMGAENKAKVQVKINGQTTNLGEDVKSDGTLNVSENRLYKLVNSDQFIKDGILELTFDKGVTLNAFTFG